jgi:polysaccharide deacetylase 2 family uncharacterized protein YibQ
MFPKNKPRRILPVAILAFLGIALAGFFWDRDTSDDEAQADYGLTIVHAVSGEPELSGERAGYATSWNNLLAGKTTSFDELELYFDEFFVFDSEKSDEPASDDAPMPGGDLPPAVPDNARVAGTPALAIVVDDCGFSMELARRLRDCKLNLTWAIIPNLRFSRDTAEMLRKEGVPFLVHVPMQAYVDPDGKAGDPKFYSIGVGMEEAEVRSAVVPLLDSLPGAYGINNHRGSKATSDPLLMRHVMRALRERGMFFMDSSTSSKTVAYRTARAYGLDSAKNNYFLDNKSDRKFIGIQIDLAIAGAKKRGSAVAICHLRPETIAFFESTDNSYFTGRGVRLVTLPELVGLRKETYGQ